jgi:hypothetical protein
MGRFGRLPAIVAVVGLVATTAACDRVPAPLEGEEWVKVWEDGFDYTSVEDLADTWLIGSFDFPTAEGQVELLPSPLQEGDRMVRLTTSAEFGWSLANISTLGPKHSTEPNFPQAQSWQGPLYVEALIRYTEDPWALSSMFMYSHHKAEVFRPAGYACSSPPLPQELTPEWDIMENAWHGHTTSQFDTTIHRNTVTTGGAHWCGVPDLDPSVGSPRHHRVKVPTSDPLGGWHLWAGYWRPDGQLCTYLDDQLLHCDDAFDSFDQPLALNLFTRRLPAPMWWCGRPPQYPDECPPQPAEVTMEITNVRVLMPSE